MKTQIHVIESDSDRADLIVDQLVMDGYRITLFSNGLQGLVGIRELCPDLILLNWALSDMSGLDILHRLRITGYTTQIILMSEKFDLATCVSGLDAGANDYIAYHFHTSELLAKVRARLRRAKWDGSLHILRFSDLKLDLETHECYRRQTRLDLTSQEFELLKYFMQHPQVVIERQQILKAVWGQTSKEESNVIEAAISTLRRKLKTRLGKRLIHTIRGVGYVLKEENALPLAMNKMQVPQRFDQALASSN